MDDKISSPFLSNESKVKSNIYDEIHEKIKDKQPKPKKVLDDCDSDEDTSCCESDEEDNRPKRRKKSKRKRVTRKESNFLNDNKSLQTIISVLASIIALLVIAVIGYLLFKSKSPSPPKLAGAAAITLEDLHKEVLKQQAEIKLIMTHIQKV